MIFVYVLIYMDFISELLFYIQDSVQISAVSHGHSGEVWSCLSIALSRSPSICMKTLDMAAATPCLAGVALKNAVWKSDFGCIGYAARKATPQHIWIATTVSNSSLLAITPATYGILIPGSDQIEINYSRRCAQSLPQLVSVWSLPRINTWFSMSWRYVTTQLLTQIDDNRQQCKPH